MKVTKETRIAVLLGGLSKERDVSLRTGKAMANALRTLGYKQVEEIDVSWDVAADLRSKKIECALIALHGRYGEDGTIQGLLEYLKIPYTGSGVLGSSVAMDKVVTKKLFVLSNVRTPPWCVSNASTSVSELRNEVAKKTGFPCVAKPVREGSTIGLSIVQNENEVPKAHEFGLTFDEQVLWEKFIQGTELTVSFLDGKPLPVIEIVPKKGLFDYEAKYTKGMTEYFCPARIPDETARIVQAESKKAFDAVQTECVGRVDVMWDGQVPWVLEVNTIPGMTETSLVPKAARAAGIQFEEMVETILKGARLKA